MRLEEIDAGIRNEELAKKERQERTYQRAEEHYSQIPDGKMQSLYDKFFRLSKEEEGKMKVSMGGFHKNIQHSPQEIRDYLSQAYVEINETCIDHGTKLKKINQLLTI